MTDIDWFARSGHLAIADVVYVEGIGLCSHQPGEAPYGTHRVMDVDRVYHFASTSQLFAPTEEEIREYWNAVTGRDAEEAGKKTILGIISGIRSVFVK